MDLFEATIKALDTENMIGGMVQYAPAKGVGTGADDYIYIATPQVEGGACASSFIITGASPVTRASDIVTVPISLNWCNPAISSLAKLIPIGMNRQTKKVAHVFLIFPLREIQLKLQMKVICIWGIHLWEHAQSLQMVKALK